MSPAFSFEDLVSPDMMSEELNTLIDTLQVAWSYADWNKERLGLDLDELRHRYLEELAEPISYASYYNALMRLVAELSDGHAGVGLPATKPPQEHPNRTTLAATFAVFGKDIYVEKVLDETCWDPVPSPGDRLVSCNGQPMTKWVAKWLARTSGSTARHRRARLALMLPMSIGSVIANPDDALVIEKPDGTHVTTGTRLTEYPAPRAQPISMELINSSVAHVKVPSFIPALWFSDPDDLAIMPGVDPRLDQCIEMIDAVFKEVAEAKTLILDVRGNEGGTDLLGKQVAFHLLPPGFTYYELKTRYSEFMQRSHLELMKLWATQGTLPPGMDPTKASKYVDMDVQHVDLEELGYPTQGWSQRITDAPKAETPIQPFSGQLFVLTDSHCFSTSDNLVACLQDEHPNVTTIGEATGGGTGAPRALTLPHSGLSVSFCTMKVYRPSGGLIEGVGSEPDIAVTPSPDDWRNKRDAALAVALQLCGA